MNLRFFFSRHTVNNIAKFNGQLFSRHSSGYRCIAATTTSTHHSFYGVSLVNGAKNPRFDNLYVRYLHTSEQVNLDHSSSDFKCESESDVTMNEFLSIFVWVMRKKLREAYPDCDKNTMNEMLGVIVEKVVAEMERGGIQQMTRIGASTSSADFSEDLWRTVWEVSSVVLQDMEKERKKEKMKRFLQSEEVKEMYRFAGQIGIRGDMLRELRFKWARQEMEKSDFYERLERIWKEESSQEKDQFGEENEKAGDDDNIMAEARQKSVSLPKRHGKIEYKIYGLNLSDPKWAEVANRIHESGKVMWPQEPKPISGKCQLVTEKILSLQEKDDPAPLLGEWKDLVQPSRIDWIAFLDRLKERNSQIYFKIAELVLSEESFQANVRDYSKLIDALAKENRFEDADRILQKMNENGVLPDDITSALLVQIYCKSGNLDRAKEAFESLRAHGFQPDIKVYNSMIMAYVNAGKPKAGETLMREMETKDLKPSKEIYMALLRSFSQAGDVGGADRISTTMQFSGIQPNLESWTSMIEAYARAGNPDRARNCFDQMTKLGHKPDDQCIATIIAAYEKKNLLDEAINLLLELEKNGLEPGVATYAILVDWLTKLELFDEAEQILEKIAEQGEAPPFKLHVSLCDMYIKSGAEKKALQALGVLESKIEQLEPEDFERIIGSLTAAGFVQDAQRLRQLMEGRGFVLSDRMKISLMASQAVGKSNKSKKSLLGRGQ